MKNKRFWDVLLKVIVAAHSLPDGHHNDQLLGHGPI